MQRRHPPGAQYRARQIQQAGRVSPPENIATRGRPGREQALRRGRPGQLRIDAASPARSGLAAAPTVNSSVGSEKPFRPTSPMRRNSSPSMPAAVSTTGRVTSTSPPAARATTRAAWLTSRP